MPPAVKPDPSAGLRLYLVVCAACVAMIALAAVATAAGPPGTPVVGLVLCSVVFGALGTVCLYRYVVQRRFRVSVVRSGIAVDGFVLGYGRAFDPLSSRRSHTLVVEYWVYGQDRRCTVRLARGDVPAGYPPGSRLSGWAGPGGDAWFPLPQTPSHGTQ